MNRITGFVSACAEVEATDLHRAVHALCNSAPGAVGYWLGSGAGLGGYSRPGGDAQVVLSPDRRYAIVLDGELYNAAELARELGISGDGLPGAGYARIVLAAMLRWGADEAAKRICGVFAVALWDDTAGTLTLVRDRMGVKPLYYGWNGRTLWFGSELKALRAYSHWTPQIDLDALSDYFRFIYIAEPLSIYQQVFKLAPGQYLEIRRGAQPVVRTYWSVVAEFNPRPPRGSEDELATELERVIGDACASRVGADEPMGLFLSGGVDSSVVAALVQRQRSTPLQTFTIGFGDPGYCEAPEAERIAAHLGTRHTTRMVHEAEALEVLPKWGDVFDEPFGDVSGIPTFFVARLAAERVPTVLLADGADEQFGSYHMYPAVYARMEAKLNSWSKTGIAGYVAAALPWVGIDDALAARSSWANPERSAVRKLTRHLRYLREVRSLKTTGQWYEHSMASPNWIEADVHRLLGKAPTSKRRLCDGFPGSAEETTRMWDLVHYTAGAILTKVDRTTSTAGLAFREPLLDHRVVSLALSLTEGMRMGPLGSKHLLRKVLYRHVPRELMERPKMGFSPPIGRWMAGGLRPLLDRYLEPRRIRAQGVLDPGLVGTVLRRFHAGDPFSVARVWLLLAFQLWHERWMEAGSLPAVADPQHVRFDVAGAVA
jgi:asparagine synthase (glutamine-hydrolysing)